ncbi:hypothetical protein PV10_05518 [Exophiala mesophila]|uniref:Uncharacterized protein n=1 Tax=Exophiala mesophila TaxID=212818 RepID=A0A0D1XS30_EXOME|nr:uncharacterized protein PV10_05518 [Exophiala mesophila]KIV90916.1 hypothetical protein PV10_05518 [Exophiala mesophila]
MTSILRLGSKDRSSFLFRRHNTDDSTADNPSLALPDISHIDPESFSDLFHHFQNYTAAEDAQSSVSRVSTLVSDPLASKALAAAPGSHEPRQQRLRLDITRNDSTGSSQYSQVSRGDSDFSPLVTRKSSSSSYIQEPVSAISQTGGDLFLTSKPRKPLVPQVAKGQSHVNFPGRKSSQPSRSAAHLPLNLDKPLPPGPGDRFAPSLSVPNLLSPKELAESSSRPPRSKAPASTPMAATGNTSHPERTVLSRRASSGQVLSELPAWTPKAVREARRTNAHSKLHERKRSASEAAVQRVPHGLDPRHRSGAQTVVLSPNSLPSHQVMRVRLPKKHDHINVTTAENVIFHVMKNLDSFQDLKSASLVSKGFQRTFQRNQSRLVEHVLFSHSRAAWEFRHSLQRSQPSQEFRMKDYWHHYSTLTALKSLFLEHCASFAKDRTILGLEGRDPTRQKDLDNAIWRIWSFCNLFGPSTGQTGSIQLQIDWLNGSRAAGNKQISANFGGGNGVGLKTQELEDLSEMWQCLQTLVAGFHGRVAEARDVGVFDNWQLIHNTSEEEHLVEWTSYLLCLGPQTVLSVASGSFDQARLLGLTRAWPLLPPGQSRAKFVLDAISQVYQDRVLEEAKAKAARFSMVRMPVHRPTKSLDGHDFGLAHEPDYGVNKVQSLRINTSNPRRRPMSTAVTLSPPIEIRPDCDPLSATNRNSSMFPTSPTADPSVFYGLGTTSTLSAKLGATLFPVQYAAPGPKVPFQRTERAAALRSDIVDPVDKAMDLLVRELGFEETRARKALAMCDSGSGIDLQKAVELLALGAKDVSRSAAPAVELPTPQDLLSPNRAKKESKVYCDGHCRSGSDTTMHRRHRSTGSSSLASASPMAGSTVESFSAPTQSGSATSGPAVSRTKTVSLRAWRALTKGDSLPRRKNSVLYIEEYQAKVERKRSMRIANDMQNQKVKDGLGKNLLGLGLGIGSSPAAKTVEDQLDNARSKERLKKEKPGTFFRPRNPHPPPAKSSRAH